MFCFLITVQGGTTKVTLSRVCTVMVLSVRIVFRCRLVRAQKSYASDGGPDPPKQTDTLEEGHNGTCSSPDTQSDSQEGSDAACSPPLP